MSVESQRNPLPKPEEIKNTNKHEDREVQSDRLHDLPDWLQEFRENLVDEIVPIEPRRDSSPGHRDTSTSSHEFPMESRAKAEQGSGKHSVYTQFPKDPNFDFCLKTKITRASCRRRAATVVPRAEIFGDLIPQITKFSVKKVNCVTIIDTLLWYKIWQLSGYNPTRVKQTLLRRPSRAQ